MLFRSVTTPSLSLTHTYTHKHKYAALFLASVRTCSVTLLSSHLLRPVSDSVTHVFPARLQTSPKNNQHTRQLLFPSSPHIYPQGRPFMTKLEQNPVSSSKGGMQWSQPMNDLLNYPPYQSSYSPSSSPNTARYTPSNSHPQPLSSAGTSTPSSVSGTTLLRFFSFLPHSPHFCSLFFAFSTLPGFLFYSTPIFLGDIFVHQIVVYLSNVPYTIHGAHQKTTQTARPTTTKLSTATASAAASANWLGRDFFPFSWESSHTKLLPLMY